MQAVSRNLAVEITEVVIRQVGQVVGAVSEGEVPASQFDGRLIFVSRVSNMFDNPTSPKCLRSVRNWYDARRRVYTGNEFIQEPKKSRQA